MESTTRTEKQSETPAFLDDIRALLIGAGFKCSIEHPGYLLVTVDDETEFAVGTANGPWEIDVECAVEPGVQSVGCSLAATSSAEDVALWVGEAVKAYRSA